MAPSQVGVDVSSSASGSAFVPQSRDSGVEWSPDAVPLLAAEWW